LSTGDNNAQDNLIVEIKTEFCVKNMTFDYYFYQVNQISSH